MITRSTFHLAPHGRAASLRSRAACVLSERKRRSNIYFGGIPLLLAGIWEHVNNPDFNSLESEGIRNEGGRNSFFLSAKKWLRGKGLIPSAGRYRRTYAHEDNASASRPVSASSVSGLASISIHLWFRDGLIERIGSNIGIW